MGNLFEGGGRVFVTGGTGFFGRALLRYLTAKEDGGGKVPLVTVLSRAPERFLTEYPEFNGRAWLSFEKGDTSELSLLPDLGAFTHVLHAATDSTRGPQMSPLDRYDQIVTGTRMALDFARKSRAKRFLLTSSGGVYGPQPEDMQEISEDWHAIPDPLNPYQAYSMAKRAAEHLTTIYSHAFNIETVIARCFAFVGEDLPLDAHFAIGNFIRDALHGDAIHVNGNGSPLRSYMYQGDLAHWLWVMLDRGADNRAYNVGSDQPTSILDLAVRVRDLLAPEKPILMGGGADGHQGRNRYIPSIIRAKEELGLTVDTPLSDAILRTVSQMPVNAWPV